VSDLVVRPLAAEGRRTLEQLRGGYLDEQHWNGLARTMGGVADAPLALDDSNRADRRANSSRCSRCPRPADHAGADRTAAARRGQLRLQPTSMRRTTLLLTNIRTIARVKAAVVLSTATLSLPASPNDQP